PDRIRRNEIIHALAVQRDPKRFEQALPLALDPALDHRETVRLLLDPSTDATRLVAQKFYTEHKDELMKHLPHDEVSGSLVGFVALFTRTCMASRRDEIASLVTSAFASQPGGDHVVKTSVENMDQCIARRALLDAEIRGWLGGVKIPRPP